MADAETCILRERKEFKTILMPVTTKEYDNPQGLFSLIFTVLCCIFFEKQLVIDIIRLRAVEETGETGGQSSNYGMV